MLAEIEETPSRMIRSAMIVATQADAKRCMWCAIREGTEADIEDFPPFQNCLSDDGCRCVVDTRIVEIPMQSLGT
jgi:hypothetical protein